MIVQESCFSGDCDWTLVRIQCSGLLLPLLYTDIAFFGALQPCVWQTGYHTTIVSPRFPDTCVNRFLSWSAVLSSDSWVLTGCLKFHESISFVRLSMLLISVFLQRRGLPCIPVAQSTNPWTLASSHFELEQEVRYHTTSQLIYLP